MWCRGGREKQSHILRQRLQDMTDEDPPFAAGKFENGYDESLTTIKGRFWYAQLKKRF